MRQAIAVANFNLTLTYCPSIANVVANALSCKQEELKTQKNKNKAACTRAFLLVEQINIKAIKAARSNLAKLATQGLIAANTIKVAATNTFIATLLVDKPYLLINCIIKLNCTHNSLQLF